MRAGWQIRKKERNTTELVRKEGRKKVRMLEVVEVYSKEGREGRG